MSVAYSSSAKPRASRSVSIFCTVCFVPETFTVHILNTTVFSVSGCLKKRTRYQIDLQGELAELRDLVELHRRKNNVSVTLTVDIILGLLSTCMFYRKHSQNRSVLNIDTPYCPLTLSPTCFKVG